MKHIGFLSFGHWTQSPQSQTRSASDALLQSIELAVAAEELGADGAYFRVHHFARQLGSPFPLLAACGARTKRIEIGTAVVDMRYENKVPANISVGSMRRDCCLLICHFSLIVCWDLMGHYLMLLYALLSFSYAVPIQPAMRLILLSAQHP
jgi:hypothetical protein